MPKTKTDRRAAREAAYEAAVQAVIDAAPPVDTAERERLSRAWRASGSELLFV